jgi:hypothetical protein
LSIPVTQAEPPEADLQTGLSHFRAKPLLEDVFHQENPVVAFRGDFGHAMVLAAKMET